MRHSLAAACGAILLAAVPLPAADPPPPPSGSAPRPIPLTRPEMKQYLEDMKARTPRIPLPEPTPEEKEKLGDRANSYESRLRFHYMPGGRDNAGTKGGAAGTKGGGGNNFGFGRDPAMSLDNTFKVQLFWIVCRSNNCQYCQGHQESKLLNAGEKDEDIAALDGDWKDFPPEKQAAFAYARKLTYEPHLLADADIEGLRKYYKDLQILEMTLSVAGNNAINRWKEGAGVPQSAGGGSFGGKTGGEKQTYLTPTPEKYKDAVSKVAPIRLDPKTGTPTRDTVSTRPKLESRDQVEQALAAAARRTPRLPLVDEAKAREVVGDDYPAGPLPQWVRLLANFPTVGKSRAAGQIAADRQGDLKPLLKAQVAWIIARQDRAWYAVAEAKKRLTALGQADDQIYALDGDWTGFTPAEQAMFTLAQKLATSPVVLTDDDVALAVKLAGPRDTTQMISYVTSCASFDRITEAAGLQAGK